MRAGGPWWSRGEDHVQAGSRTFAAFHSPHFLQSLQIKPPNKGIKNSRKPTLTSRLTLNAAFSVCENQSRKYGWANMNIIWTKYIDINQTSMRGKCSTDHH